MGSLSSGLQGKHHYKPLGLEIANADPFLNDRLNRRGDIENLTTLLANSEPPLVFAIDGKWGSGKTTFMRIWKAYLAKEYPSLGSVYFSAWETDFADDPLYAFLGEVNEQLACKTTGMSRFKWERVFSLAGKITKRTLPVLAKVATYGALDINDEKVKQMLAELSGGLVSDTLETYKASVNAIKQFKDNLADVLKSSGSEQPIIVFVDELDRCRPNYAITLLERIKHLLNLPGLVFVLGIDRTQLANAVRGVYGDRFDAEIYLQRFIDLDYQISPGDNKQFIENLLGHYGLDEFFASRQVMSASSIRNESKYLLEACCDVAKVFNLSLRGIEQLLARVNIVARSTHSSQSIHPHLLLGLLALRIDSFSTYSALVSRESSTVDFIELISRKCAGVDLDAIENIAYMIAYVVQAFSGGDSSDPGYAYLTAQATAEVAARKIDKELADAAAMHASHMSSEPSMRRIDLNSLVRRIEMAERFRV